MIMTRADTLTHLWSNKVKYFTPHGPLTFAMELAMVTLGGAPGRWMLESHQLSHWAGGSFRSGRYFIDKMEK